MIVGAMALRGLVPFAVAAVLIAVGSSLAVVSTVRPAGAVPAATETPFPVASAARSGIELSRSSRLAFWRDKKLWVSNLDGSLRYAVASTEDLRRVSLTRWSLDGSAVAFVDSGLSASVVTTEGGRVDVDLPIDLRDQGYRISDLRWAPDGRRIAATLLRPGDGRSDAFLIDRAAARPAWTRLTSLEDVIVGDWISNDELLAHTSGGVIGVIGTHRVNAMRLISGVQGVSPIIGPEGRIHFLVGRIPSSRDPSLPYITANRAAVWSAATDGGDARRESTWELNDVRLDARLPDGRYLVHRGSSNSQGIVTEDVDLLPANAGVIERVRIAPDGRTAYGSTPDRIVRIDLTRLAVPPATTPASAVTVFLDTGGEADVWFPSSLSLARGGERAPAVAAARSVFSLGSHIWQLDGGIASLLRPAPVLRRTLVPGPRWSPTGDHVLVVEQAGPTASSTTFVAVAIDRSGNAVRINASSAAARSYSWSPTGGEVAIVVDKRGVSGIASDAQLEVRFFDPSGRATRSAIPGNEVSWTAKGILVLRDVAGTPTLQRIEGEGQTKTLVTRERLILDGFARAPTAVTATLNALDAARDGSFASVRMQTQGGATGTYVVLVDAEGTSLRYLPGESLTDLAWSPTRPGSAGPLLGYTLDVRTASERATITSPTTGETIATRDGRFAGWSPDGQWYFVAKVSGLFAYSIGREPAVRVGPGGAPLSTAPAR
jgi:Tol biopolymer transport system component